MVFFWICGLLLDLRVGHVGFYQRVLQWRLRRGLLAIRDYSGTQSNCGSFLWFSYVFQGNIFRYIPYTCLSCATSVLNVYAVEGIIIDVMDVTHLKKRNWTFDMQEKAENGLFRIALTTKPEQEYVCTVVTSH